MLELSRARRASKKGTKLIGLERYSEAGFAFTTARELFRKIGDFERAAVACIEAKAAMKLARKQSESGVPGKPPTTEMQKLIIERWNDKIHVMTVNKSDSMTLTVDNERKLARSQKH
ncbi:MAG: hypothetical protein QGH60_07090 [Phycisphaerae bacterium]|jgi:hypothetical protein|nr:hypothetical protein [Phycisphaerae bacterium]